MKKLWHRFINWFMSFDNDIDDRDFDILDQESFH